MLIKMLESLTIWNFVCYFCGFFYKHNGTSPANPLYPIKLSIAAFQKTFNIELLHVDICVIVLWLTCQRVAFGAEACLWLKSCHVKVKNADTAQSFQIRYFDILFIVPVCYYI